MPHTSRKRTKLKAQSKYKQIEGDDGWTHVIKGTRQDISESLNPMPSSISDGMTMSILKEKFEKFNLRWRESAAYNDTEAWFDQTLPNLETMQIDSAVCLALGSFTGERSVQYALRDAERSLSQLVAFESWIDSLRRRFTVEHVYFQDPSFTALDIEFLHSRGGEVLQHPAHRTHISETTFLFAPCPPSTLLLHVLHADFPPLAITNDIGRNTELESQSADTGNQLQSFLRRRSTKKLAHFDLSNWMHGMSIFWKPCSNADISSIEAGVGL